MSAHAWPLQVLWPRLVANKLFRKTSGSHAFVTDFPVVADDDQVLDPEFGDGGCSPDADASRCVKRPRPQERSKTLKYKYVYAFVCSFEFAARAGDLSHYSRLVCIVCIYVHN